MTPQDIEYLKSIEFYASSVNAWFGTSLEHDKSVLTLSAGGIGLLITLLTTVGLSSAEALVLYIFAIFCFLVALISVLLVFRLNRIHIKQILAGEQTGEDPKLAKIDAVVLWSFCLGMLFATIIGISSAINSYSQQGEKMTKDTKNTAQPGLLKESVNGAAGLQSGTDFTKSFNGVANLAPKGTTQNQPSNSTGSNPVQDIDNQASSGK